MTALSGLTEITPTLWISAAMTPEDKTVQRESEDGCFAIPDLGTDTLGRFVVMDEDTYDRHYNVISNPMMWFVQHYLWDLSNVPDIRRQELEAWELGYQVANRLFAAAVSEELERRPGRW